MTIRSSNRPPHIPRRNPDRVAAIQPSKNHLRTRLIPGFGFGLAITLLGIGLASSCRRGNHQQNNHANAESPSATPTKSVLPKKSSPNLANVELAHKVIYADRTSQGYLLLLDQAPPPQTLSRQNLTQLVRDKLGKRVSPRDLNALLKLISTEPHYTDLAREKVQTPDSMPSPDSTTPSKSPTSSLSKPEQKQKPEQNEARPHLLGLHIDQMPLGKDDSAIIAKEVLQDSILARDLSSSTRDRLNSRQWLILLRADYRIADHFLGLRLLQELVAVVANEHQAIIHDPDTLETMEVSGFSKRKLASTRLNIADQIAVIPFPDPSGTLDSLRLTTRGMRRFGSVDIELSGLPKNSMMLQRATDFMYGVAKVLSQNADIDPSGMALEVQSTLEISPFDIQEAYSPNQPPLHCPECKNPVQIHLIERKPLDTDAMEYTVARIVAPREASDRSDYDHVAWIESVFLGLFGSPVK